MSFLLLLQPDLGFRWRVSQAVPGPNTYRGSDAGARLPPVSSRVVHRDARETITGPFRRIQCVGFESRGSFQLVPRSGKGQAKQRAFTTLSRRFGAANASNQRAGAAGRFALRPRSRRARGTLASVDLLWLAARPSGSS